MKPLCNNPRVARNEPCPCGSGKKFKKCCISLQSSTAVTQPSVNTRYRFEAGSYGEVNNCMPSIACIKMIGEEEAYHFVLVKPDKIHGEEALALLEATQDIDQAFKKRKTLHLSEQQFAAEWKNKGYIKVDGFKIAREVGSVN